MEHLWIGLIVWLGGVGVGYFGRGLYEKPEPEKQDLHDSLCLQLKAINDLREVCGDEWADLEVKSLYELSRSL